MGLGMTMKFDSRNKSLDKDQRLIGQRHELGKERPERA
jgi:hypothetical protein